MQNPVLVSRSGPYEAEEGCLSLECRVKSFDITSDIPFSHNAGYCTFLCPE